MIDSITIEVWQAVEQVDQIIHININLSLRQDPANNITVTMPKILCQALKMTRTSSTNSSYSTSPQQLCLAKQKSKDPNLVQYKRIKHFSHQFLKEVQLEYKCR